VKVSRLSASSIGCFESCEARFHATYVERAPEISGDAAVGGTAAHEALEEVVASGMHLTPQFTVANVTKIYERIAMKYSLPEQSVADGKAMMKNWVDYHHLNGFDEVLATESKKTFTLTHPRLGEIPVTYIFDRADWNGSHVIVTDYKTFAAPMSADNLRRKVQVRLYGVAAAIEYRHLQPQGIIVKYHLLRYDAIGLMLTRDDNIATWAYLQNVWERIEESTGTVETVGPECRWCVRRATCDSLRRHIRAGGVLGLPPERMARELADTKVRISALNSVKTELEDALSDFLDGKSTTSHEFEDGTRVYLKPSGRRDIDGREAADILGPDLTAQYGTIGVTILDKILKDEPSLTDDQRARLKALIKKKSGATMQVDVPSPMDDM
jgi:hypothetical protein